MEKTIYNKRLQAINDHTMHEIAIDHARENSYVRQAEKAVSTMSFIPTLSLADRLFNMIADHDSNLISTYAAVLKAQGSCILTYYLARF